MTLLEDEFVALTTRIFSFLEDRGFASSTKRGAFELQVIYRSSEVEIRIEFETEDRVLIQAGLLIGGSLPDRFDANLNERMVDFIIDTYFEHVDATWKMPTLSQQLSDATD